MAEDLARVIRASRTRRTIEVWRGNRSVVTAFGVAADRLSDLTGTRSRVVGFFAASLHRGVAETEFVAPPGPGGPVLVRVTVPGGAAAAWIAGLGDPDLRYQQEVLMSSPAVRYGRVDRSGPIPIVEAEVE